MLEEPEVDSSPCELFWPRHAWVHGSLGKVLTLSPHSWHSVHALKEPAQGMVTMKALTALYTLACLVMIRSVCSSCVPSVFFNGTVSNTSECINMTDFKPSLNYTPIDFVEGGDLTVNCVESLPPGVKNKVFVWCMNGMPMSNENTSVLHLHKLGNVMLIILVCGVSAVGLVLALGICTKFMMYRQFGQMKNRRQNAPHLQNTLPTLT
ncbi:hypothetical protein DPEC_G00024780 [Dallia pectoralis]|uniref:Uncharacterized protein n=1 Tax=Dallia pectoralis TaxID=75939 RepID=A0ACC2HIM1_DALPE|nr:hypothetical protein DPEC_G00024780 [Dallia pectoralis]